MAEADGGNAADEAPPARPVLRIVRGDATPEEIAALLAIVAARGGGEATEQVAAASAWAAPAQQLRQPVPTSPGSWQRSGWVQGTRTRADW
jgi:Acyl-CoA carboxylase epsilon subunit